MTGDLSLHKAMFRNVQLWKDPDDGRGDSRWEDKWAQKPVIVLQNEGTGRNIK